MNERRYTDEELDSWARYEETPATLYDVVSELNDIKTAIDAQTDQIRSLDRSLTPIFLVLLVIAALVYRGIYGAWW